MGLWKNRPKCSQTNFSQNECITFLYSGKVEVGYCCMYVSIKKLTQCAKIRPMSEKFAQWAKNSPNEQKNRPIWSPCLWSKSIRWVVFEYLVAYPCKLIECWKFFFFFSIWFAVRALQPDIVKGCQIFLVATHQNRKKIYLIALKHINWPPNLTNGHKIYQMVVK
jgi:hypothetical protein